MVDEEKRFNFSSRYQMLHVYLKEVKRHLQALKFSYILGIHSFPHTPIASSSALYQRS